MAAVRKLHAFVGALAISQVMAGSECSPGDTPGSCAKPEMDEEAAMLALRQEVRKAKVSLTSISEEEVEDDHHQHHLPSMKKLFESWAVSKGVATVHLGKPTFTKEAWPYEVEEKDDEARMVEIIEGHFKGIDDLGEALQANDTKLEKTWLTCANIDWPSLTKESLHVGTPIFKQMEQELGIENCWDTDETAMSTTCKAIWAAFLSMIDLQKEFPQGPKFHNAFVSDWGKYPSWFGGAVVPPEPSETMPPQAKVVDPNGMNGFILCDIIRTVLTQSPNQVSTGTCWAVASLGLLSHKGPAKAIKSALRLVWTGRHSSHYPKPCDNIYEMQPGLVPYHDGVGRWFPNTTLPAVKQLVTPCSGNPNDCSRSAFQPAQPLGATFAWYQALISQYSLYGWGSCSPDEQRDTSLTYPGMSFDAFHKLDLGGNSGSAAWACQLLLDPQDGTCELIFNPNACGDIPYENCMRYNLKPFDSNAFSELVGWAEDLADKGLASEIPALAESRGGGYKALWQYIKSFNPTATRLSDVVDAFPGFNFNPIENTQAAATWYPSFTEDLLDQTCQFPGIVLTIAGGVLQNANKEVQGGVPRAYFTVAGDAATADEMKALQCDHAVALLSCNKETDTYVIWSWGTTYSLSKTVLLGDKTFYTPTLDLGDRKVINNGAICSAVVAQRITYMEY